MRRETRSDGQLPVLPTLLVVVGAVAVVAGVAVPVRAMAGAPAPLLAGSLSATDPPVLLGLGLVTGGTVSLTLGALLIALDPSVY